MRPIFLVIAVAAIICGQVPPSGQPRLLVLAHVNVVDVTTGSVRRDYNVTIAGDRIAAVEASTQLRGPADAQVIDARGKYLIPGLVDMHVHGSDERFLNLFVANGVTSVRLMWGMPLHLDWRKRSDSGELLGPRLSIASPLVDGPKPVWPGSTVVADARSAKDTVGQIKRGGYDFVKIYSRLPREAYFSLLNDAKAQGLAVAGHVPLTLNAAEASDAGQKSIEHLTGILLAASSQEGQLRQQSLSALTGGEAGEGIDSKTRRILRDLNERLLATYDPSRASRLFARLAKNGTWQCPTLTVLRSIASLDDPAFVADPRLRYMPLGVRASWDPAKDPRLATKTAEDYALDRRTLRKQFEIVGTMRRAGVRFLAGTDVQNPFTFPGFSLHDELSLLVEAGLTTLEALQSATINPATYLGTDQSFGTIATGKAADFLLLDANPIDDIRNTKRIAAVIIRGRLIDRGGLDSMLATAEKAAAK
jgi:imidazolonepropionase-like amidohydrolase